LHITIHSISRHSHSSPSSVTAIYFSILTPPTPPPFFFFNDTATTEIYTLSLHDALPIYAVPGIIRLACASATLLTSIRATPHRRSEEHTSELQSHLNLVCRLLLEKKKKKKK